MEAKPDYFENLNLTDVITPVTVDRLIQLLKESKYDANEIEFLEKGFKEGFNIEYYGPKIRQSTAENIPFKEGVGDKVDMWNKIMKEVRHKRVAGPFDIPFDNYIQSPIGLVPKAGNQTCLIFHLSYDCQRDGQKSLNFRTPKDKCSVHYHDLDYTIHAYLRVCKQAEGYVAELHNNNSRNVLEWRWKDRFQYHIRKK